MSSRKRTDVRTITRANISDKWREIYRTIEAIPEDETRTYGEVSLAVYGHVKGAQSVGSALRFWDTEADANPAFHPDLPWERVISSATGMTPWPGD